DGPIEVIYPFVIGLQRGGKRGKMKRQIDLFNRWVCWGRWFYGKNPGGGVLRSETIGELAETPLLEFPQDLFVALALVESSSI
ncbi:hypothetical protein U1Q18_009968, partial [Sarracenia purpurea var. burkii]